MRSRRVDAAAGAVALALGAFAARRLVFLAAALTPGARREPVPGGASDRAPSSACVVVPAHDEAAVLEDTLAALAGLRGVGVSTALVSDGSSDGTFAIMERWAAGRRDWTALALAVHGGKGAALNAGIAASQDSELIATCDADVRADPDCLSELVRAFADPRVAAASALLWPVNSDESIVTRYCALELWQHQLITSAAKDRLGLNPPAHGWLSCYRREALEQIGGFPLRSLGEDVEASNALVSAGWQTRFVARARVLGEVPRALPDYWRQHVRWSRGLYDAAPHDSGAAHVSPARRLELWLHATGYFDRLVLIVAASFAVRGRLSPWLPAGYVGLLGAEAVCALALAGQCRSSVRFLTAAIAMFPVDAAASLTGAALQFTLRERRWQSRASRG